MRLLVPHGQSRNGGAATAVAVISVVALGGCSADTADPPSRAEKVTSVFDLPEGSLLPAGRYRVPFAGLDQDVAEAELDVREGFEIYNGSFLWHGGVEDPSYALSFWRITGVSTEPCSSFPATYSDPGPTVTALASALRRQPQRQGPAPVPQTLAGHEGLYLELSLKGGFDPAECATGSYNAWHAVDPETNATYDRYQ